MDTQFDIDDSEDGDSEDNDGGVDDADYQGWVRADVKLLWKAYYVLWSLSLDSRYEKGEDHSLYFV